MARHRRLVITAWVVLMIACGAVFPLVAGQLKAPNYGVDQAASTRASTLVQRHFSGLGNEQDVIVFDSPDGTVADPGRRAVVDRVLAAARAETGVVTVVGPFDPIAKNQVSEDGHAALALVGLEGDASSLPARAAALQRAVAGAAGAGVTANVTGFSPITNDLTAVETAATTEAESIGLPLALVILVLAFGAALAAALPLLLAIAGLTLTFGVLYLLSFGLTFDAFLITIVTMIGTGIGIDYAMFIVSRFREELARRAITGRDPAAIAEATGVAIATSGRTIAFSGVVVGISVCSFFIMESPIFREVGTGVLVSVICTLIAALTLLPAVLAVLGPRVNKWQLPPKWRPADARSDSGAAQGLWAHWAHLVMRRPVLFATAAGAILVVAALPIGSLRYGIDLGTTSMGDQPTARAQLVLDRSFSPGAVSPVQVVITGPGDDALDNTGRQQAHVLATTLSGDHRVGDIETLSNDGRILLNVVPKVAIDSGEAIALVRHIRDDLAGGMPDTQVLVGGATAAFVDLSDETTQKLPWVIMLVLGMSLLFLLVIFRSIAVPVKAVLMNLLATAAATGLTVAVFQWGYGAEVLGFTSPGFLQVYIPITVFVLLFGLSMDYEVFLIRRIQEAWEDSHDTDSAIAVGIEHTARPITAAAAIMVAVFGSFLIAPVPELKQFGFSLAIAIAIDATLVRLVLVPALIKLFGDWNWWLPAGLDRVLPRVGRRTQDAVDAS
ncbi:MMPL family transporter [Nocardia sp. NBC_00508]|uniref:MMPL family transporter n=1 Tax=Nocardia sp. NBC_00508 TaxID=2975992 RepID=UPI002E816D70|nr:MMPL family transporter [Nocardia sp. NBC_00508]WUD66750.1 MMPL family transporter [Nocardia sp. NBC_00508]